MLGWILLGAALLTATAIIISVSFLDKCAAQKKLKENNIKKGVIKKICESKGVKHIKLDAIDINGNEKEVEFEADDYNKFEICEGMTIVA